MSESAFATVVSDTMWQPSSRINFLDGTLDGGLDVVKCTLSDGARGWRPIKFA